MQGVAGIKGGLNALLLRIQIVFKIFPQPLQLSLVVWFEPPGLTVATTRLGIFLVISRVLNDVVTELQEIIAGSLAVFGRQNKSLCPLVPGLLCARYEVSVFRCFLRWQDSLVLTGSLVGRLNIVLSDRALGDQTGQPC